ncbi:MAG: hypothetical protein IRZ26_07020 [Clostridia bacterium]|nr:hypothetical protein [Clostridia bacterium]
MAEVTPKFPPDLLPEGRLVRGEAILFPNLSPYDEQSAVAVLTREHHVPLGGFRAERLADGFLACAEYFRRAGGGRGEVYGLVSWNYMPPSGSTQIHPHLQAFLTETPGNALEQELEASRRWAAAAGRPYWAELVEAEERLGERFVARGRASVWLTAFVSQGPLSDLLVVFPGRSTLAELPEEAVAELAEGLVQALRYLAGRGVSSFNLAFFPAAGERDDFWLHLRLSPRLYLAPRLGASDISSLQHLYQEPYMIWTPEELAAGLRGAVRPT